MRTAHRVRLAAILALGAFALHQLRYLIGGGAAAAESHRYMTDLLPALSVLALAALLATLIRGTEGAAPSRASLARRVTVFACALLTIYVGQELLESLIATHQAAEAVAVLGGGSWIALPLALAIGTLAALLVRALEGVERVIAVVHAGRVSRTRAPAVRGRALAAHRLSLLFEPLAFGLARRPPPPAPA
jgi:hypothetical protein